MTAPAHRRAAREAEVPRGSFYLHPGEMLAADQPMAVTTILGSCVSVCLFDAERGVGGLNHYLLPDSLGARPTTRFGDIAVPGLVDAVVARGARRGFLEARVFGGACVLEAFCRAEGHLGQRNIQVAMDHLEQLGIPVRSRDTGGRRGRKLVFHTDSGTARVSEI